MLFWKDVRRVLFSGSRYRILGRLNHDGIRSSWVPVKLVDVLSDVDPDLARQIGHLELGLDAYAQESPVIDDGRARLETAVIDFGVSLSKQFGGSLTREELTHAMPRMQSGSVYPSEVESRRALFQLMTDFVKNHLQVSPDAETVARLREAAIAGAGLNLDGTVRDNSTPRLSAPVAIDDHRAIIDCEIIAVYW